MNLSVSPISIANKNINFGMARFSPKGLQLAASCAETYPPLGNPSEYDELVKPEYYKKVGIFTPPFVKFVKKELKVGYVDNICDTITACATSNNPYANAMFIKQLIAAEPEIRKVTDILQTKAENATEEEDKEELISTADEIELSIAKAAENVLQLNWDNPFLSIEETDELLEMAEPALEDNQYVALTGAIQRSDI